MTTNTFFKYLKEHRVHVDVSELQEILTYREFFDQNRDTSINIGKISPDFKDKHTVLDCFFVEGIDDWITIYKN